MSEGEGIEIQVNKRKIVLHCPACGEVVFYQPRSFLPWWQEYWRCKCCNLDIALEDNRIKMVMEEVFME